MLTFIKFGGSTITHKTQPESPDLAIINQLAHELHTARVAYPAQRIILGHGSGSFGHIYAARYGIHRGLAPTGDWSGFAHTSAAVLRLNRIIVDALLTHDVPALALQPSTSLQSVAGTLTAWQTHTIDLALQTNLLPVIHGDVAFDSTQGSAIISTEALMAYLALHTHLCPNRIILVGQNAVYTADPNTNPSAQLIPHIHSNNIEHVLNQASHSHGIDVTGGMHSKVMFMWHLVQAISELEVYIIPAVPGLLTRTLLGELVDQSTRISHTPTHQ